jgi:glycogen debranching enzyme
MKKILLALFVLLAQSSMSQQIISGNPSLDEAFKLAVRTVDINTRRGILAAGGDYGGEWTRDIAINSWNGVSLFRPNVAEASLWSVTIHKDTIGQQFWDKIIWSIAAFNHYLVTGDKAFLARAYSCSVNTMKQLEQITFDSRYGLFMGPSVFNDGIAGYPEPVYEPGNHSGSVLDHKNSYHIKCLSTNCIYYEAYKVLAQMNNLLSGNADDSHAYLLKAGTLKASILKNFYNTDTNTLNYLIDQNGKADHSQEALGISFAVMFGVIDREKAKLLVDNAVVSNYGIPSITPDFPRYSRDKPGRHNNLIWPFINGFFANAAIVSGSYKTFDHELNALTHLALDEDKGNCNFREIYNPNTGKPDGGYQDWGAEHPDYHWESCKMQTWSATACISMVIKGLVGMKFNENSITFDPYLPDGIGTLELKDVNYRNSILNITLKGKGNLISSFALDGKNQPGNTIPSSLKGMHVITIILKNK